MDGSEWLSEYVSVCVCAYMLVLVVFIGLCIHACTIVLNKCNQNTDQANCFI